MHRPLQTVRMNVSALISQHGNFDTLKRTTRMRLSYLKESVSEKCPKRMYQLSDPSEQRPDSGQIFSTEVG
jgi:hypothetical protein